MAVGTARNSSTFKVTLPSDLEIDLSRVFDAPRRLVFEAFTKPEHVKRWWGCMDGYFLPVCEIDLRPGGAWRFVMRGPDGKEYRFHGVYLEITAPERIVHTEIFDEYPESLVTVTFVERDGKTTLTSKSSYPSKEVRDFVLKTGMEKGAAMSWDLLEDLAIDLHDREKSS